MKNLLNRLLLTAHCLLFTILIALCFSVSVVKGVTNYVGTAGTPGGNYFTDIQSAVDAASGGDFVIVSNGTYILSSQIDVNKSLTIQSVSGPENTVVDGNSSSRCFNLYMHNTIVSGFAITNGNAGTGQGGGIYCTGLTPMITNCVISGNSADSGGGAFYGTVNNCAISGNSADDGGGTCDGTVNNCTISGNTSEYGGGGSLKGTLNNCTISGNSASDEGGGACCWGGTLQNSILWNNINSNYFSSDSTNLYNCIENWTNLVNGIITNNPEFINAAAGDYRLESFSPCIDAGTNMSWMWSSTDLDGNPRITGGIVDMGCYEFVPEPDLVLISWFGFSTFFARRHKIAKKY